MKKILFSVYFGSIALLLFVIPVKTFAREENHRQSNNNQEILYSLGIQSETQHFFRGLERTSSLVLSGFASISAYGFSGGVWYGDGPNDSYHEFQAYLAYSYPLGIFDISMGMKGIDSNNMRYHSDDSFEIFTEIVADPILGIVPSFAYYFDLKSGDRDYGELKFNKYFNIPKPDIGIQPYVLLGFGDYWSSDYSFSHFEAGAILNWSLSEKIELGLYGSIIKPLDGIKELTGSNEVEESFGIQIKW